MPKIILTVPETVQSVVRPVVYEIARDILQVLGQDPKTPIQYPDTMDVMKQAGSSIESQGDNTPSTGTGNKLTIDVQEDYEQDRLLSTAVMRPENLFVFRDDALEVSIRPAYSSTDMTLNLRYRAVDATAAKRWRDDARARLSRNQTERLHDVSYHFLVPPAMLAILEQLHRMRETVGAYGDTFEDYLKAHSTPRLSKLTTLAGTQERWGVAETQLRIVGWFDFVDRGPEKAEKDDESDTATVNLAYHFKFDQPIVCHMNYPLMVHNQLVPQKWRPSKKDQVDRPEIHHKSYAHSAGAFAYFEKGRWAGPKIDAPAPGVQIPDFDEFVPAKGAVPTKTMRLFTALTSIDTTDPANRRFLLDLNDFSRQWKLDADVLAYMRTAASKLTKSKGCVLKLDLYNGRLLAREGSLTVGPDLKVYSTEDLSLRNYYHVRLALALDWASCGDMDNLREHGQALCKLAKAISPGMTACCCSKPNGLLGGHLVTRACLKCIIDEIDALVIGRGDQQIYQFNTVQTLFVETERGSH